jgi:hypothetical protein
MGQWRMCMSTAHAHSMCPLVLATVCMCGVYGAPWAQNSRGLTMCESSEAKIELYWWLSKGTNKLRVYTFHLDQDLLWLQKEDSGVLRNMNDQWTLSHSFLLRLFSCISQLLSLSIEVEGKIGQPITPFPFCPSLVINKTKVETLAEGLHIRKWNRKQLN